MSAPYKPHLKLVGITKVYPNNVVANKNIDLTINRGRVHVIVGENGAGKTTLMNVLFGMIPPTSGEIVFKGKKMSFKSTYDSIKAGIGMIHQHFKLADSLTVLENCFLGIEPKKLFFTNRSKMKQILNTFLRKYDLQLPIDKKAGQCSTSTRQLLEIIKTLIRGAELLIMDEPTSLLMPQERDRLFNIITKLKKEDKTILFVTHKLYDALTIGDDITVMRQGRILVTIDKTKRELNRQDLLKMIFKNPSKELFHHTIDTTTEKVLLAFNDICLEENSKNTLNNLSFSLHKRETLGFAGLTDSGQQEIINIIMGYERTYTGLFQVLGKTISRHTPQKARSMNLSYIPSDRLSIGSDVNLSIWENLISTQLDSTNISSPLKLKKSYIMKHTFDLMQAFTIKAHSPFVKVGNLSGGNIQKTILARELSNNAQIILADNPTHGVDNESEVFIRRHLTKEKNRGKAILLFSNDLEELKALSDRIIVLYQGTINGEFTNIEELDEYVLGACMLGRKERGII